MNRFTRHGGALVFALLLACSGRTDETALADTRSDALSAANRTTSITILHVNDSHSTLDSFGPKDLEDPGLNGTLGGLTRAAPIIAGIRAATENTLFVHAGDVFEGDLAFPFTAGVVELQLLRGLGLDAFTLGNHELDYGPDVLAKSLGDAGFLGAVPVLSANLIPPAGEQALSPFVTGHVVRTVCGVRVGIFGLTTPSDPMMQPGPFVIAGGSDAQPPLKAMKDIAMRELLALRSPAQAGGPADVVILLSHLGTELDHQLADQLPRGLLDFIVGGHTEIDETFTSYEPGKTMVVQAGNFYHRVGRLDLTLRNRRVIGATHELITVDATAGRDDGLATFLQENVKDPIDTYLGFDAFNTPVAFATDELSHEWAPDMGARRDLGVGDLAADALKTVLDAQIGLTTAGFLNDAIYPGPVVANDLFRALPYGVNPKLLDPGQADGILPDPVLKVVMSGAQLYAGFEFGVSTGEIPQVSEDVFVCYDASASPAIQLIAIGGVPIAPDPETTYSVATNIFLVGAINQVFAEYFPALGQIEIPPDFDPMVSQFSVLLQYAAGRTLSNPVLPRVVNTADCAGSLVP